MKTPKLFLIILLLATGLALHAQVSINADGSQPDPRTMLDVKSTSKGVLLPRLTEFQRDALYKDVPEGMLILNTTSKKFEVFFDGFWYSLSMSEGVEALEPLTDIDGNTYNIVKIGEQVWMAENLRTTKYNDDTSIPTGHSDDDWEILTTGAYAIYPHTSIEGLNSDAEVLEAYGALYNWYAVNDARGLCPTGWHIPNNAECTTLSDFIGGSNIGNKLKSCRQVSSPLGGDCATNDHPRWDANETYYGTNDFGFAALPGGSRDLWGGYSSSQIGVSGAWWSLTAFDDTYAYRFGLSYNSGDLTNSWTQKTHGFSIRCIKD